MQSLLEQLITPILENENAKLVELQLKGRPDNQIVKIFVDTEDGVTLDKCKSISRQMSDVLDSADIFNGKYRLEVSSPGLDRPLLNRNDFARNMHKEVDIKYESNLGIEDFKGKIVDVSYENVSIQGSDEIKSVPISKIKHGKISLPW